jgi:predicted small secreted protein
MKKIALPLVSLLTMVFVLTACNTSKKIGKRLDGTWQVTSVTLDGQQLTGPDMPTKMKFVSCQQGGPFDLLAYCKGTLFYDNDSEEFDWYVSERGAQVEFLFYTSGKLDGSYDIVKDNKNHFEFLSFDGKRRIVLER